MGVIDFRLRPPTPGIVEALRLFADPGNIGTIGDLIAQMDSLDIRIGAVPARANDVGLYGSFGLISDDAVEAVVRDHPDRFVGFVAIDADRPEDDLRRLDELGTPWFRGVILEPALCSEPVFVDDPRFDPVYDWCSMRELPLALTLGGVAGPDLGHADPVRLDRVAGRFPKLDIVVTHACWPWVGEAIGVAYRRPNVYLAPDSFLHRPGGSLYVEATNDFLADRVIFAGNYPSMSLDEALRRHRGAGFDPSVLERTLHDNAARLLRLQ